MECEDLINPISARMKLCIMEGSEATVNEYIPLGGSIPKNSSVIHRNNGSKYTPAATSIRFSEQTPAIGTGRKDKNFVVVTVTRTNGEPIDITIDPHYLKMRIVTEDPTLPGGGYRRRKTRKRRVRRYTRKSRKN